MLVASIACTVAVLGLLVAVARLRREVRTLASLSEQLRRQTVPLVADAHRVVDQAATEMERVGAVLDSTESVHATVETASRLAYRAFANPVVKVLAVRAGAATGIRRLAGSTPAPDPSAIGRGAAVNGSRNGSRNGNGNGNGVNRPLGRGYGR